VPGVIATPHLGASTAEAEENCAMMIADQLKEFLENGNISNSVNFPNIRLARTGKCRLAIANENRPDMLAQMSHALGASNVNIMHMLNESRGDMAYTLIDVECDISDAAVNMIKNIDGVLSVRVI
jgi:D-3-phosphoglycerate dehydrogenase